MAGEGGLLAGLRPQPWSDPGCFLQKEEHIVSGGVDLVVSQKQSENTAQASIWDSALSQPAMGTTFFFPIIRIVSMKEVKVPPPNTESHICVRRAAYNPVKGDRSGNKKMFSTSPTPYGSSV